MDPFVSTHVPLVAFVDPFGGTNMSDFNRPYSLRMRAVSRRRGECESKLYNDTVQGLFPRPVRKGRSAFYPIHELESLEVVEAAEVGEDGVRDFVRCLHAARLTGDRVDPKAWLERYRAEHAKGVGDPKSEAAASSGPHQPDVAPAKRPQTSAPRPLSPSEFILQHRRQRGGGSR